MAGKIHALITRGYPKGRDWYDLLWYCGRRPKVEPNLIQLHNALVQTQGKDAYSANDWKNICLTRVKQLPWFNLKDRKIFAISLQKSKLSQGKINIFCDKCRNYLLIA